MSPLEIGAIKFSLIGSDVNRCTTISFLKFSNCLYKAFKQIDGYFINDFYSPNNEFSAILPGWKNKLNEKFKIDINKIKNENLIQ